MSGRPRLGMGIAPALLLAMICLAALSACAATVIPQEVESPLPEPTIELLTYHTVQPGDTLWRIAGQYAIDPAMLALVNELENPNLLQPGQILLVSEKVTISGRVLPTPTPTPLPCLEGCLQPHPGCLIKGIVTRLDGLRLYVLPEDSLYLRRAADMWFCRIEDAEGQGWRRWTEYGPATPGPP